MNQEQLSIALLGERASKMGQIYDAISIFEHLISKVPDHAETHFNLAILHLLCGNFQRGWVELEWRLKTKKMAIPAIKSPRWDGRMLDGKTILIMKEWGLGDMLQFVRYAKLIKQSGGRTVLYCQPQLSRLLATAPGIDRTIAWGTDTRIFHDTHVPIISLPGIFQTSLLTIPADIPYLSVPPGAGVQAIKEIMRHTNALRIGLAWKGGLKDIAVQRSLKLEQVKDLLNIPGVRFFSLPRWNGDLDISSLPPGSITDLGPHLSTLDDTAAAIQAMDLIISVDTTVVHLAGALGKPVWTLLPFMPDWRWMLNREDSPWYPTMRLFRQPKPGDWASVIQRVAEELKALVETKK